MGAARAVAAAPQGKTATLAAYPAQCGEIRRIYRHRADAYYAEARG